MIWEFNVPGVFDTRIARARAGSASALALGLLAHGCTLGDFDGLSGGDRGARAPDANGDVDAGEASDLDAASATLDDAGLADAPRPDRMGEVDAVVIGAADSSIDASIAEGGTFDAAAEAAVVDAAREATAPDAAPIDAGPPGESACYTRFAARLMCEGFESETLSDPWNLGETHGQVTRVTAPAPYRGAGALSARVTDSSGVAFAFRPAFPGLREGSMFMRSYLYVPSGTPIAGVIVHGISEENPPYGGVSILLEDARFSIDVHPRGPGLDPIFVHGTTSVPLMRDTWLCLQLEIVVHPTEGAVRLRVNGSLVAESAEPLGTLPATGYRGVSAGLVYLDPAQETPLELHVDELVADTASIGCDGPRAPGG
jgi:hypothetical protein